MRGRGTPTFIKCSVEGIFEQRIEGNMLGRNRGVHCTLGGTPGTRAQFLPSSKTREVSKFFLGRFFFI